MQVQQVTSREELKVSRLAAVAKLSTFSFNIQWGSEAEQEF